MDVVGGVRAQEQDRTRDVLRLGPAPGGDAIEDLAAAHGIGAQRQQVIGQLATIDEGRHIVKAVHENGIVLQTGTQQRSSQRFRLACELVRNGRIGKLKQVTVFVPAGIAGGVYWLLALQFKIPAAKEMTEFALAKFKRFK